MSEKPLSQVMDDIQNSQIEKNNVFNYPRTLYPPIEPFKTHMIKVSEIHTIYVEECGNPNGKPVIVCHGGPGGGCEEYYRQFFDPQAYHIILFDQRGSGRSTPSACLEENTTWHLVDDMEAIRTLLNVNSWVIFGGSWGSTLALSYAETHPSRTKGLILRGIFTLRRAELLFFYQYGTSMLFPEYFEEFMKPIPLVERCDLMGAYHRRLTGNDEKVKQECANAWTKYEMSTSALIVNKTKIEKGEDPEFALKFARIENHYFVNGGFFKEDGQLINNAHILKNIPGIIVQGRYDVVCPAQSAYDLHKAWPNSDLVICPDSGHSMGEKSISSMLIEACDRFRSL